MNIRKIEVNDLVNVLTCNLYNLPENYCLRFWAYIILNWPDLSFLAEDESGKVVGYVLSSIEPAEGDAHTQVGHINSLSVLRPYRRLGLAQKLMNLTKDAMIREGVTIEYLQLHVRKSNRAARSLYDQLDFKFHRVEKKYYADDEDAVIMRFPIHLRDLLQQQEPPSSDTQKWTQKTWMTNLWHRIHVKSHWFTDKTMALLRRRNSHL